ncbi:META domain-containing protein [Streptomyces sp. ALI-76-A]|jgi:heat shock protein HslJ|uniref:META domain-containing protein n=1 Tax=Streptomyces sp. ALI-76-A TaxID=3025736 RepID=UPI00256F3641|nr:META domain-containing protein [Streptomyces sp. ALI-76-A]MDL5202484.1 META domain-containing protein [Streptomyces sp. ALI-76-A]
MYRQKQRQQRLIMTAAVALLPLAAACGGEQAGSGGQAGSGEVSAERPVTDVRWNIDRVTADGTTRRAQGEAHLTFDKKTGKVGGRLGCNHVNATATVRDGHITLGRPSTTRMMCDASLMKTEKALLGLFNSTLNYRVDQETLTLTSQNATIVRAVAAE